MRVRGYGISGVVYLFSTSPPTAAVGTHPTGILSCRCCYRQDYVFMGRLLLPPETVVVER